MKINMNIVYATCRLAIVLSIPQFTKLFSCLVTGTQAVYPYPCSTLPDQMGFHFSVSPTIHIYGILKTYITLVWFLSGVSAKQLVMPNKNLDYTDMVSLLCKFLIAVILI